MIVPSLPIFAKEDSVYVIPIENEVEKGLYQFLKRGIEEAEEAGAKAIIFDIDTPGGAVNAATDISELLSSTELTKIAYVNPDAISAGAYIALHADEIYFNPNGKMGAAAIIDQTGNTADKKAVSYWLTAMEAAAETGNRDPLYALAMADESVDLPEYRAPEGKLLTLNATSAQEVGYSEGTFSSLEELLEFKQWDSAEIVQLNTTFAEELARFITNPLVVSILLSVASLGFIVELYSPGLGIPGAMALTSIVLFFYGHLVAGLAGYESIILFGIGIILIVLEFFVPGGIAGILGILAVIGSILLAGGNIVQMSISILIAMLVAVIGIIILVKVFGKRMNLFNKIILRDSTNTESGYVSNVTRRELIGRTGTTLTPLRPSGSMTIDEERIDVVSEGGYVAQGKLVRVIKTEGSRVIVREHHNQLLKEEK
ncbi:membrane protein [Bacillus coahuilensis m2-6]|uniref:NfeD family protein n=2 Tax=Bacillus coahuilensis TaxID=408580 RepID=UPI0007504B8D|nr:nodulation protein NfeD [Bacillus coahuilensis]KUP07305.1 membrane protein [Bacillus coahuilensis m2-6]